MQRRLAGDPAPSEEERHLVNRAGRRGKRWQENPRPAGGGRFGDLPRQTSVHPSAEKSPSCLRGPSLTLPRYRIDHLPDI